MYVWIGKVHRRYKAWPAEFIWLWNFGWEIIMAGQAFFVAWLAFFVAWLAFFVAWLAFFLAWPASKESQPKFPSQINSAGQALYLR